MDINDRDNLNDEEIEECPELEETGLEPEAEEEGDTHLDDVGMGLTLPPPSPKAPEPARKPARKAPAAVARKPKAKKARKAAAKKARQPARKARRRAAPRKKARKGARRSKGGRRRR